MKLKTPAKINPLLYILSKREDGFHELYMHMVPVSLFDTLSFCKNKKKGLIFKMNGATISVPLEEWHEREQSMLLCHRQLQCLFALMLA